SPYQCPTLNRHLPHQIAKPSECFTTRRHLPSFTRPFRLLLTSPAFSTEIFCISSRIALARETLPLFSIALIFLSRLVVATLNTVVSPIVPPFLLTSCASSVDSVAGFSSANSTTSSAFLV